MTIRGVGTGSFVLAFLVLAEAANSQTVSRGTLLSLGGDAHVGGLLDVGETPKPKINQGPNWDLETEIYIPFDDEDTDECSFMGYGEGRAAVGSTGGRVVGEGTDWPRTGPVYDWCVGEEILVQMAGTGTYSQTYEYIGDATPVVNVKGSLTITGRAELIQGECGAAALGYVRFESSITEPKEAKLAESSGETSSDLLFNLGAAYDGGGVTVPIRINKGHGTFSDSDSDTFDGESDECRRLGYTMQARGLILARADGPAWLLTAAECKAWMQGVIAMEVTLGER
ncbi:MAG: hypothetical protein AB1726_07375 [Planctomycetota bacterium]